MKTKAKTPPSIRAVSRKVGAPVCVPPNTRRCPYCLLADLTLIKDHTYFCFSKGVSFYWDGKRWRKGRA